MDYDVSPVEPFLPRARELHRRLGVFVGYFDSCDEPFQPSGGRQSDLAKLDAAGVRMFVASIGFGCYFQIGPREYVLAGPDEWLLERQLQRIDYLLNNIRRCPRTRLVTCKADLGRTADEIGVIVHLTGNNHTIDLGTVDVFFQRGVRATHPGMQYHNRWCSGRENVTVNGRPAPVMTGFGRQVVARMNELGIALDTAHMTDASARALIRASAKPVSDSHTCSRDLVPGCGRGLGDETLRMVADSGGVIGMHFADAFVTQRAHERKYAARPGRSSRPPREWAYNRHVLASTADPDERVRLRKGPAAEEARKRFYRRHDLPADPRETPPKGPGATLAELADHVEYLRALCGVEHVGLGGDVNGIGDGQWPAGMRHVGELPNLTAELLRRGWREEDLSKVLWGNWARVLAECLPA